ncbi:hypothetical protein [Actinomadura atramentaria]|uniref:hypothetical protein n=1 Tax=Actinomadura atramentaria TaxID=1990 RepID=UPI000365B2FC|nr:hypothetical protein [Actinomadura atramentaria]
MALFPVYVVDDEGNRKPMECPDWVRRLHTQQKADEAFDSFLREQMRARYAAELAADGIVPLTDEEFDARYPNPVRTKP